MIQIFPAGKSFSPLQKQVCNIVLNAHNTALKALKAGVLSSKYYLQIFKNSWEDQVAF